MPDVVMTNHSVKRTKERIGLSKKIADKNAQRALEYGVTHSEAKGGLCRYRKYTDYVALTKAFDEIRNKYHNKSLAFPYGFGCGLANGDWNIVENMINTYFADMDVTIYRLSARSDEV